MTMSSNTALRASAETLSDGYCCVTSWTISTGNTSMPARVPMMTGIEKSAIPITMTSIIDPPSAGLRLGMVTRRNVRSAPAPETFEASSSDGSSDWSPLAIER